MAKERLLKLECGHKLRLVDDMALGLGKAQGVICPQCEVELMNS